MPIIIPCVMTVWATFMSKPLNYNHRFPTKNYKPELQFDHTELQVCLLTFYFIFCKLENIWKRLTWCCRYPIIFESTRQLLEFILTFNLKKKRYKRKYICLEVRRLYFFLQFCYNDSLEQITLYFLLYRIFILCLWFYIYTNIYSVTYIK